MGKLTELMFQHPELAGQVMQAWLAESTEPAMLLQRLCNAIGELERDFQADHEVLENIVNRFQWQSVLEGCGISL